MGRLPVEPSMFDPMYLGTPPDDAQHPVKLTKKFLIGVTEVAEKQWRDAMGTSPWSGQNEGINNDNYPANYFSRTRRRFMQSTSRNGRLNLSTSDGSGVGILLSLRYKNRVSLG